MMYKIYVTICLLLVFFMVPAEPFYSARAACRAQGPGAPPSDPLRTFLRTKLTASPQSGDKETRYFSASVDLNDDGTPEVVVYLTGPSWCGSGGCTALILASEGTSYRVVTKLTLARPPIRMFSTKTHGWHDLGVWVEGGGVRPGHEALLRFSGAKYPGNPSTSPRVVGHGEAVVVVPQKIESSLLY